MGMVRAFIAIRPPSALIAPLEAILGQLRSSDADFRWESAEKLHATIKFLGNVEESKLPVIYDETRRSARGLGPFDVVFGTLGGFPDTRHPRVVWVGCSDPSGALAMMRERLDDAFTPLGFKKEDRPFRPHVTLGRAKSPRGVEAR